MDAAEEVFAQRGYYGSSLRDVSARANAALGVINHHFPSKEILFYEVVMRKRDMLADIVKTSMDTAAHSTGSDKSIIEAFIRPFLRACVDSNSDVRNYIRLTSHFMSTYRVPEVAPAIAQLAPISDLFCDTLRRHVPEMPEQKLCIAVYLIEAALIFMVQDAGFLERVTNDGFTTESINELIEPAAIFFTGGLQSLSHTSTSIILDTRPNESLESGPSR
jgi:AcrR family transcriptional regulator